MSGSYDISQAVRLKYLAWINPTTLRAASAAAATTISVRDASGYAAADSVVLNPGALNEETATVSSVSGTVITLSAGLVYDHAVNEPVGELADPTTLTVKYQDPSGNETTLVYLTDAALVRDSLGKFHVILTVDEAGRWFHQAKGTGAVIAAGEEDFYVRPSEF